ncbi:hypothetical protein JIQ42_08249 [Leishmania sp. Namibia]|uniref:hypothetical protein n=1 Tax=Leishmania sp. Namibia TaxID=2802991 RepID=UPI001B5C830C|nr:hypothetical protein JIQ42_08249 [Leishmania sp. Namibia]
MENHASASMYIPSSKVLARLQRHAAPMGQTKSSTVSVDGASAFTAAPAAVPPASSSTFSTHRETATRDTLAALSASPTKLDAAAALAETSAAVSKPSGAAESALSMRCASSPRTSRMGASTASESAASGAASVAHTAVSDAATPPNALRPHAAPPVFTPQIPGSNSSGASAAAEVPAAAKACGAAPQTLAAPAATPSSPAPPPPAPLPRASAWLLPQDDVTYILSSLTWNVDLLRLLLPHAPCPLHLPDAEPLAEAPSSSADKLAAATPPSAAPASPTPRSIDVNEEEVSAEAGRECLTMKSLKTSSIDSATAAAGAFSTGTLASVGADTRSDATIIGSTSGASAVSAQDETHKSDSPAAVTGSIPNPRPLAPSSSAPTASVSVSGTSAAVSTVPLTWSQYLFREAGGSVRKAVESQQDGAASVSSDVAFGGPQQQNLSTLVRGQTSLTASMHGVGSGLPHSHSDGALVCAPKSAAGAPAAAATAPYSSVPSSIFHAHYVPSLEEFQRQLEEQRHRQQLLLRQQQQQQHPPALSATRLQKHLQQQPQSSPSHHRRRAAANRTFLYSPTPSVMSLATAATSTTVNTVAPRTACEEEEQRRQLSRSGATLKSPNSSLPPAAERGSFAADVPCIYASSAPPSPLIFSSTSQMRERLQQPQHLLSRCEIRVRPCAPSASSLGHLGSGSRDDEEAAHDTGVTEVTTRLPHSTSYPSRPSSQPQQLSKMMMQAADRLCATILPSAARAHSPLLLHMRSARTSRNSRGSSRATARGNVDDGGVEGDEEDEEWISSRRDASGSGSVWPPNSSPASPTASISSVSLGRVWSSTVSGRATPRTTLATGVSGSVANHSSHFNAKGGKNARRRRKATCTRRQRTMRVYMPSITEGPKAASLYTAPTAEAQELMLLLLHRAAAPLSSGVAGRSVAGHSAAATAVSSVSSTPRTYSMAAGARLSALPTTTASTVSLAVQPSGVAAAPRPNTFAEAARVKGDSGASSGASTAAQEQQRQRHGLTRPSVPPPTAPRSPEQAGRTPRLSIPPPGAPIAGMSCVCLPPSQAAADGVNSTTARGTDDFASSTAQEQYPHPPRQSSLLSTPRFAHCPLSPPTRAVEPPKVHFFGGSTASSLRSHDAATDAFSASCSGVTVALPSPAAAVPALRSLAYAGSSGDDGAGHFGNSVGVVGRDDAHVSTQKYISAEGHRWSSSTPASAAGSAAPVELPQWVRERSLSALYYQPWGLELLARYEASRQEQQRMRARMARRVAGPSAGSSANAAAAALSESGIGEDESKPPSPSTSMLNSSVASSFNISSDTAPFPYTAPSPAAPTAAPHAPVPSRPSIGTSGGGCVNTATEAAEAPHASSSSITPVSWAAALRQPQNANLIFGSSGGLGSTTAASKTIATAAAAAAAAAASASRPPAVVLEWPPELSAAEEMDAWEEAYYFGRVATPPSLSQQQQLSTSGSATRPLAHATKGANAGYAEGKEATATTDLAGRVSAPSGQARAISGGSSSCATSLAAASAAVPTRQQWCLSKDIQPPTLYLSRQRRSSRRRFRAAYPSDTFRSSTARRAGATSAAAELFHRRKDAKSTTAVDEASEAPTCVERPGEAAPESNSAARGDVALYNGGYARKKAAQLLYPALSLHEMGTPPPPRFCKSGRRTAGQGSGTSGDAAALLSVSSAAGNDAMERVGGVSYPPPPQQQQRVEEGDSITADGHVKVELSAAEREGGALEELIDNSDGDGGEVPGAAGSGVGGPLSGRSLADNPHGASSDRMSGAAGSASSAGADTCASTPAAASTVSGTVRGPRADVDVIFFLQKFIRAVLIVLIAQVRLQQLQHHQELEQQACSLHNVTCPAGAYLLKQQAQAPRMSAQYWPAGHSGRGDPEAAATSEVSDGVGLSKLERSALSFVRHYMADYRHMITAYVMRDDREVARRSAQAILSPPPSTASALSMRPTSAAAFTGAMDSAVGLTPDPLFRHDILRRWLNATRVNAVYEDAVRVATNGIPCGADANPPPATPLDDVESLRTAQVYISGKDAAWQPLLMELLQVSRVVQCYSDGPVVAAPEASGEAPSAPATPAQRILLASLEKFLAQPTLPLLRHAGSGASATAQAQAVTLASPTASSASTIAAAAGSLASDFYTTTPSLTPAQESAAAQMVEESDAFRAYLLSGYLRDGDASNGTGTTGSALSAAASTTSSLRHSQSAPALSSIVTQQWQQPRAFSAAAMPPFPAAHAMSHHHQRQQPESSSPLSNATSLLQPLTWYPYAYMPGTANPYAESTNPNSTRVTPTQAAHASHMTLHVAMLPLSGRLLWRWVVPAEDTDNFNLSVFFQSSLFSFMQGGPLPMPSAGPAPAGWRSSAAAGFGAAGFVPTPMMMAPPPSPHPSLTWPPALAARIDAQLRSDALRSAWGELPPPCMCGTATAVRRKNDGFRSGSWGETPEVTLVHCSAGMHRSCGILIAFLLWLLYQCRQVLHAEQTLGRGPLSYTQAPASGCSVDAELVDDAAVNALLLDDIDTLTPAAASAADGDEEQQQPEQHAKSSVADASAPWLTSRLLQRAIRHVQQQRSIAVPIRTVLFLLQSFANELRLG